MRAGVLTPILWDKSRLGEFENWIYLNPFTSMIEALKSFTWNGDKLYDLFNIIFHFIN